MTVRTISHSFDVALPLDEAWAIVSDTQKLNQLMFGLNPTTVVARDAQKARLRGTFGRFAPEYDEYPWVYEAPRRYRNRRVFTSGPLRSLEAECSLSPCGPGTRIQFEFQVSAADGLVGILAAGKFRRSLRNGLEHFGALMQRTAAGRPFAWPPANPRSADVFARAEPLVREARSGASPQEAQALERLIEHVAVATDLDVSTIRPYAMADAWGLQRRVVLEVALRAAKAGLLRLSWDLLCPSCEAPESSSSLRDIPRGGHCPACDIDFTADFERNVEATFRPEPAVRVAERTVFCFGSPALTRSWLAQVVVPPRSSQTLTPQLGVGRYRLQAHGVETPVLFDVAEASGARELRAQLVTTDGKPHLSSTARVVSAGACTITVDNPGDTPRRVQLAWRKYESQAATAADVTATGLFRELFGADVLSPEQHVDVGRRTILFTDLVGSTAMYERVGDAAAYGMVRRHFDLLAKAVAQHNGQVVKTVGDAVMAAFDIPVDGARAGLACIEALRTLAHADGTPTGLKLRVGVHAGPCLAVGANDRIDYFGRTVNVAARVESLGGPDELVLSWAVRAADAVPAFVEEARGAGHEVMDDRQMVKGVAEPVDITRIRVRPSSLDQR